MYSIIKTERKNQYVLFDNELNMPIAAGSYREMRYLVMTLKFRADVNLYIPA